MGASTYRRGEGGRGVVGWAFLDAVWGTVWTAVPIPANARVVWMRSERGSAGRIRVVGTAGSCQRCPGAQHYMVEKLAGRLRCPGPES